MSGQSVTLESLVARFRRYLLGMEQDIVTERTGTPELEIRFRQVAADTFVSVLSKLTRVARGASLADVITNVDALHAEIPTNVHVGMETMHMMVNSIMEERERHYSGARTMRPQQRRQITFAQNSSGPSFKASSDKFVIKAPLIEPLLLNNSGSGIGLPYLVSLSSETPTMTGFSSDEGAVLRVIVRVSFAVTVATATSSRSWKIEMSVVRQMTEQAAQSLKQVMSEMFSHAKSAESVLKWLADPKTHSLYKFEIECELDTAPEIAKPSDDEQKLSEKSDESAILRPADITAIAEFVMLLADSAMLRASAYQAETYQVARVLIGVNQSSRLSKFERELGLKRLMPQVIALTKAEYRALPFPPVGYMITTKADGFRAVVSVRDGVVRILGDKLIEIRAPTALMEDATRKARLTAVTLADCELVYDAEDVTVSETKKTAKAAPKSEAKRAATITNKSKAETKAKAKTESKTVEFIPEAKSRFTLYIFDVMAVHGEVVTEDGLEKRILHMEKVVKLLADFGVTAHAKPYTHIDSSDPEVLQERFLSVLDAKTEYPREDAVVMAEPGKPYMQTRAFKWKSLKDNTIDFLARRAPPAAVEELRRTGFLEKSLQKGESSQKEKSLQKLARESIVYFLFNGISPDKFSALGLRRCPGYAELWPVKESKHNGGLKSGRPEGRSWRRGYFPIQFSPSDSPLAYVWVASEKDADLDGKAVELRKTGFLEKSLQKGESSQNEENGELVSWELVKVRTERTADVESGQYFGNDFRVAELTWLNYLDVFPREQLWEGPSGDYFAATSSGEYRAHRAFMSFVKSRRIEMMQHAECVIDLMSGQGQDLGRYVEAGVRKLVMVDRDKAALAEAVRRRHGERIMNKKKIGHASRVVATSLRVVVADLNAQSAAETWKIVETVQKAADMGHTTRLQLPMEEETKSGKKTEKKTAKPKKESKDEPKDESLGVADFVVCNLGVHYLLSSTEHLQRFAVLCRELTKINGQVVLLALRGTDVHATFTKNDIKDGQSWDLRGGAGEALKYSLKRMYSSATLQAAGQKIGVLLPFSDGGYYEEYLVNAGAIIKEFEARGFVAVSNFSVSRQLEDFRTRNASMFAQLTADDIQYLGLFGEIILKRVK